MPKKIIILAIAIILLAGVMALLLFLTRGDSVVPPEPTPDYTERPVNIDFTDVTAIEFTPRMGMAYTITLTHDGEDATAVLTPGRDGFDYQHALLLRSARAAVALEGISLLQRDVPSDELTYFGFDEPLMQWTIHAGERQYSLEMGADAGGGDSVYVRMADSYDVYLLPFAAGRPFARAEHELRHLRFLPDFDSRNDALIALNYFNIQGSSTPFALRRMTDDEAAVAPLMAMYQFTAPTTMFIDSHYLNELLFDPFFTIGLSAVVEDDPVDLARYGLDDPYIVVVRDVDGWEATLLVGDTHMNGGRYVKLEGVPTVFHDAAGDYSFLDIDYTIFINRLFWLHEIVDVERVEYRLGDLHHVVVYDAEPGEERGITFHSITLDGEEISTTNGQRLYQSTLLVRIHDRIGDDVQRGERYGSITIVLDSGGREELAFYYVTERIFNARLNGEDLGLTVHRNTIDDLRDRFAVIQDGGTLGH